MTLEQMEFIGVHGVLLLLWQAIYSLHHHILIHKVSFTVATASPSAALHGRGRGRPSPPKTTTLISSLLPMVSKVMRLALPSYVLLLSTLPTLAGTSTKRASWLMLLRVDMLGRVPCTLQRVPTACTSVVVVFFRSISPVVVTVAPYAASRSRVDSTLRPCFTHGRRQDETLI